MNENYMYRTYCELVITSTKDRPIDITNRTEIQPSRAYTIGDVFKSKSSSSEGIRKYNLWAIKSEEIISDKEDIKQHIQYFRNLLSEGMDEIVELKKDKDTEMCFWIWIESDSAGLGLDLMEEDMVFLFEIANRLHISIVPFS